MRFRTTILQSSKTATGIPIPEDVVNQLGAGRKPAVSVTLNGYTYRSTIATVDGRPMVGLSAENRAASGARGGDEIDVEIELDTAPRVIEVPGDLAAALEGEPAAMAFFDSLSYSQQRWHADSIRAAKTDDTRARRVAKSVEMLREGRKP
jgi:Bacteriocin-protection, YdeI or OmpD-Associated/Domain of unknown function (DUF1905)